MGTDLELRRGLDLTRAPDEQWNEEMVQMVARSVFRGLQVSKSQLYYCLTVADSLDLNPMVGEIYFIPSKSRDGKGPALVPYIGRTGLVKKATVREAFYEAETVRANDRFRITRRKDHTVEVSHSYGATGRGEVVGAYAFLHFRNGDRPAFAFAPLEEYLPSFDAEWKMNASPWGNQRSAMIEKCFDAETEVLTDRGFELFSVAQGRVLQVTAQGLEPVDARPFWQAYEGPMVTHASREVDFAVTPNHDLLLTGGRIEAGEVYDRARARPTAGLAVVRCLSAEREDAPGVSDASLALAGYYMADGHAASGSSIVFNLSRPRKLAALRALGLPLSERPGRRAGTRVGGMTATMDATWLRLSASALPSFVLAAKRISVSALLALSPRQVRVFVDAWVEFDGDARHRLYCTDPERLGAFEVAAVHAGYSVSPRRPRINPPLSQRPNYVVTLSSRAASDLRRWGRGEDARSRRNVARRRGLEIAPADGRGVWCVSVPSGVIVVRRAGFSMLCGNCAMIMAGRKRLDLGNVLADGEIDRVLEQQSVRGPALEPGSGEFDWSSLQGSSETVARLQEAVDRLRDHVPDAWPAAKLDMVLTGLGEAGLIEEAERIEAEVAAAAKRAPIRAPGHVEGEVERVTAAVAAQEGAQEAVVDAEVVADVEHAAALRKRLEALGRRLDEPGISGEEVGELSAEHDAVRRELAAIEDPGQESLL